MNNFNIIIKRKDTRSFTHLRHLVFTLFIGLSIILTGTIQETRQANAQFSDSTPPTANPTQSPSANKAGWTKSDVTITWNWSDDIFGRGIDPNNCTTSSTTSGEGRIDLTATCSDRGGNVGSASYTVQVDKTPPVANTTLSSPANANGWNNGDVTINWSWSDSGGSGINPQFCADGSAFIDTEGTYKNTVTCIDVTGNVGSAALSVQIDKIGPDTTIHANPLATSTSSDATFEFSGSDALSGIANFECQLDGGGFGLCTSPQSYSGLTNGSHTFEVRAIDEADNVDQTPVSHTWIIAANTAPVASDDTYSVVENTVLTIAAPGLLSNDSDIDDDMLTAMVVNQPTNGALTLNTNGSFSYTPNADFSGNDSFTYMANDGSDNSNIATVSIAVTAMPSPAGHWAFNEGGCTTVVDSTGNGYHVPCPLTWSSDTPAGNGYSMSFDGIDDYILIPDAPALRIRDNFTLSLWFRPGSTSQSQKYLLSRNSNSGGEQVAIIYEYMDNTVEFFSIGHSGENPRAGSQMTIADTNWHHIAYTYDGTNWVGYLDGNQIFALNRTFSLTQAVRNGWFVGAAHAHAHAVDGLIDEVQIYNQALSNNEIQALVFVSPVINSTSAASVSSNDVEVINEKIARPNDNDEHSALSGHPTIEQRTHRVFLPLVTSSE
ncbi:cadherin-like domain-containing protein [Chloroflexi bacterium TSY]|nr:cadherin-like domain-containing protein [Chloroflexi bacterium TSY]